MARRGSGSPFALQRDGVVWRSEVGPFENILAEGLWSSQFNIHGWYWEAGELLVLSGLTRAYALDARTGEVIGSYLLPQVDRNSWQINQALFAPSGDHFALVSSKRVWVIQSDGSHVFRLDSDELINGGVELTDDHVVFRVLDSFADDLSFVERYHAYTPEAPTIREGGNG